ncbi:unnamed protein product [Larinioides sclopetarius]|uniref:Uncharacterized protein n=1 Tax=Larinioides sclopetarius TaxID=280406 RepID=A0AAV2AHL3_9ARAC
MDVAGPTISPGIDAKDGSAGCQGATARDSPAEKGFLVWVEDLVSADMQTKFGELFQIFVPSAKQQSESGKRFLALIMAPVNGRALADSALFEC